MLLRILFKPPVLLLLALLIAGVCGLFYFKSAEIGAGVGSGSAVASGVGSGVGVSAASVEAVGSAVATLSSVCVTAVVSSVGTVSSAEAICFMDFNTFTKS